MLKKVVVAVAAAMACASVAQAAGNEWEVHGYGRLGGQWDGEFNNRMSTLGKQDYRTVTSNDENNNQLEVTISKKNKVKGDVWSNFVVRAEYGNQNAGGRSAFYSSQGSEHSGVNSGQFEVKEAYIEMGGFDFLGKETKIWTGQRFLNRSQGLLSKEFWKQSSGVGFGVENGKMGAAIVSNDPGNTSDQVVSDNCGWGNTSYCPTGSAGKVEKSTGNTITSLDLWYSGLEVPGGNLQFDFKYINRANMNDADVQATNSAGNRVSNGEHGVGAAVTYNTNWYGVKGWTQNVIAYGEGLAANRGVNVGSWSDGFGHDSKSLFLTSYGVADLSDAVQLATEVTYWAPQNVNWGNVDVKRFLVAVQPSIKLNNFTRLIFTGSYAAETVTPDGGSGAAWGRKEETTNFYALEAAVAFTLNSDYFGRPQIKPFVNWVDTSDKNASVATNGKKNQIGFGVEGEIWF